MTYQSPRLGCIKEMRHLLSQHGYIGRIKGRLPEDINASNPLPFSFLLLSPIFSVVFKYHIQTLHFPCIQASFLFPSRRPLFITTHIPRWGYLTICNRRLTNVSSLCMGYPSTSLPIRDRGPAPHSLKCRQNVSQCSVPTNLIF